MFWCDAGSEPVIETAWLDGSRRVPLVRDRIRHPTGLAVDLAGGHLLYWADTKLNHIESMRPDGSNRAIVLKGGKYYYLSKKILCLSLPGKVIVGGFDVNKYY